MFYGFVITEAGNSLLASMVAGQTLTITKAVVGEGTADNAEAARKLTNLIDPGPEGTSTVPTVEENSVNMIVEYRSDLNGGLQQGFWIGEFGIFGKVGTGAETLIGYGSLGDAKQYVSAYVSGTAPDVRRYPVSITVTTGIQVDVAYPAEAWMTAEDVADLFNQTLKPELEESLDGLIEDGRKMFDHMESQYFIRNFAGIRWKRYDPQTGEILDFLLEADEAREDGTRENVVCGAAGDLRGETQDSGSKNGETQIKGRGISAERREAVRRIRQRGDCVSLKELAVSGRDLMAAGMKPGKAVGETLQYLLSQVLEKPGKNKKDVLLALAVEREKNCNGI